VRGLVERYMSINTTRLPRKTPWVKFAAIAVGGLLLGPLGAYFMIISHNNAMVSSIGAELESPQYKFPVSD